MTLILTNEEIGSCFTLEECFRVMDPAFIDLGNGVAANLPRQDLLVPGPLEGSYHGLKSAGGSIPRFGVTAARLTSDIVTWPEVDGERRRVKVPLAMGNRYVGLVFLFSTATGELLAIFPDGLVQAIRVGVTNALAPFFQAGWIRDGMHIATVRSSEMTADALLRCDRVVVSSREAARLVTLPGEEKRIPESGQGDYGREELHGTEADWSRKPELGELMAGKAAEPGGGDLHAQLRGAGAPVRRRRSADLRIGQGTRFGPGAAHGMVLAGFALVGGAVGSGRPSCNDGSIFSQVGWAM